MEKDILFEIPHVKLIQSEAEIYCLIVEDTALNDYVEDLLWDEFEYQSTSVSIDDKSKSAIYSNYFDESVNIERVIDLLKQLDVNEVARIFELNN